MITRQISRSAPPSPTQKHLTPPKREKSASPQRVVRNKSPLPPNADLPDVVKQKEIKADLCIICKKLILEGVSGCMGSYAYLVGSLRLLQHHVYGEIYGLMAKKKYQNANIFWAKKSQETKLSYI